MKRKTWFKAATYVGILFLISCVTVNIYFPAKEVEQAADEIVRDIRGPAGTEPQKPEGQDKRSSLGRTFMVVLGVNPVYAQDATRVNTPTIRAIKDSLKQREPQLEPFFSKGNIGEGSNGLIVVRNTDGLDLKQRSQLNNLVSSTNQDRDKLYAEVATALKVDPSQAGRVREQFAQFWQQYSKPGWFIQLPNGSWQKK